MTQGLPILSQVTQNIIYIIIMTGAFLFFFGGAGESNTGAHTHSAFIPLKTMSQAPKITFEP